MANRQYGGGFDFSWDVHNDEMNMFDGSGFQKNFRYEITIFFISIFY